MEMTLRASEPPHLPLHIVTGFLGAGKTTLLNRLLGEEALGGAVVLVNEFGAIGLDQLILRPQSAKPIALASGCVCCARRDAFAAALEDLLRARDNARLSFDCVILETTGLADPAPVLQTLARHPYLAMRFRLESIVAVVDAATGIATLDAHDEAVRQAALADVIAISKTDLVDPAAPPFAELLARLAALNPAAVIGPSGELNASSLRRGRDAARPGGRACETAPALHPGGAPPFQSIVVARQEALSPASFERFLSFLQSAAGGALLRVKGLVQLTDDPARPALFHAVQGALYPVERLAAWPDGDIRSRLTLIGRSRDRALMEAAANAFLERAQIDCPDLEAIATDPLVAPPRGLLA